MDIASLIGGLGIGSMLTLFLKEYFDSRKTLSKRAFEEKREAYTNYLDIALRSQTIPEKEAVWARTAAAERIRLCGSLEVIEWLEQVSSLPKGSLKPVGELVQAMRKDLFPQMK